MLAFQTWEGETTLHNRSPSRFFAAQEKQIGATAIEFALAFPLFFALLYAILMYGFLFLTQMGLQHAAEDGARAVLSYPGIPNNGAGETQLSLRQARAEAIAYQQLSWLPSREHAQIEVAICAIGTSACTGLDPNCQQGNAYTSRCQVIVTVSHPYGTHPLIPSLPGFNLLIPNALRGNARMLLDGRALSLL